MRKRLYLVLGMLLVAALGGLVWWAPLEPRDVVYEGKPLSYWLGLRMVLYPSDDGRGAVRCYIQTQGRSSEVVTIRLSDSNAVPFLVRALRRDRWFGARYYRKWLWPKLPRSMKSRLPLPPADNPTARWDAVLLLGNLGPVARSAVPALIRAAHEKEERPGDNAELQRFVPWALGKIGAGNNASIAVLVEGLKLQSEAGLHVHAINSLRDLGEAAKRDTAALSALTEALRNRDLEVRIAATNALLKIDPEAAAKAGVLPFETMVTALTAALKSGRAEERYVAAVSLGQPGQTDERIISALIVTLSDNDERVRGQAAVSLGLLGQRDDRVITALIAAVSDAAPLVRCHAAEALGNLGRADDTVITALAKALGDRSSGYSVNYYATDALVRLGPEAASKAGIKPPSP
jgi:HEAT repeat protein